MQRGYCYDGSWFIVHALFFLLKSYDDAFSNVLILHIFLNILIVFSVTLLCLNCCHSISIGPCPVILCNFLLPWRICWIEVSFLNPYIFDTKMFWEVTSTSGLSYILPSLFLGHFLDLCECLV